MDRPSFLSAGANELHETACKLAATVPDFKQHMSKSSHVWIVVERHDAEQWAMTLDPKDRFLWIKGRTKIKLSLIHDSYINTYIGENPDLAITLKLDGSTPPGDSKVGDLDYFNDRIIVLGAVLAKDTIARSSESAVPPECTEMDHTHQITRTNGRPNRTPSRQPLQAVNRQLAVAPKESTEKSTPLKRMDSPKDAENVLPMGQHSTTPESKTPQLSTPAIQEESSLTEPTSASQPDETQQYKPHEIENPFAIHDIELDVPMRGKPLRELAQDMTPERLEAGVKVGVNILSELQAPLEQLKDNFDAQNWLDQIESVRKEAAKTRTVVGVVGNTGAGKSSVINAMLDEERLVPTNCMRACTAVVTELSYNNSNSDLSRYRAEIEFIQPEDWRRELKILFEEAFDESGHLSKEAYNADSQAGIAYAKMRAVYNKHTKDMLANATIESLMRVKNVKNTLGTTKRINERQPDAFYRRLQHFVDSKEKGTEKRDKNGNKISNSKREFEYWPLIKVVKIYTKADALSTGAVIVDLPGVHDSNAARAAVAEGYIKRCSGLWIVAPINRAVDDKAAKTLLGNTFKRQLKYDGTYSAVTFICSKTDDISRTEAADSLQLGAEMEEIEDKLVDLDRQRKDLSTQLTRAKDNKQDHSDAIDNIEDQLEKWEDLQARLEDGETVYAPSAFGTRKRKRSPRPADARKRRRRSSGVDSDEDDSESVSGDDDADSAIAPSGSPLTAHEVEEKTEELKGLKKDARRERGKFEDKIRELRKQITQIEEDEAELDARQSELCIAGRNEYSRSAIRFDFATGIRELDQETAEEEDPDNFNPEEDIRDYHEVARSLPVYCVSSRAYQKLSDRLQKDTDVSGFTAKDQTEIPQLQAHCKKLTERGRQASCRRFLNSLNQLLTSLGLWYV